MDTLIIQYFDFIKKNFLVLIKNENILSFNSFEVELIHNFINDFNLKNSLEILSLKNFIKSWLKNIKLKVSDDFFIFLIVILFYFVLKKFKIVLKNDFYFDTLILLEKNKINKNKGLEISNKNYLCKNCNFKISSLDSNNSLIICKNCGNVFPQSLIKKNN